MSRFSLIAILLAMFSTARAQQFEEFFRDSTLRIDYILAGDASHQSIFVDELASVNHWYGRRVNLDSLIIPGAGQVEVRDHASGRVIFRHCFSTLFQEWQSYPEAQSVSRSFQHVALVPMPRQSADVTLRLLDNHLKVVAENTTLVNPSDILIRSKGNQPYGYETILSAKDPSRCIRIAFIGDGYTDREQDVFIKDAMRATDAIFSHEPFAQHKDDFNVVAVCAESAQSGTSVPRNHIWRRTLLSSHFDTFYSDRYLTTLNIKDLHDALAGTPYDHIIILVNTQTYGGGGILNFYNLSAAHNASTLPVVVHEFGHSFAGLADEYAYASEELEIHPLDIEPWAANITLGKAPLKWADVPDAALYEGAGYRTHGIFRAFSNCRMRSNDTPSFCPVCQRAITQVINWHLQPLQ